MGLWRRIVLWAVPGVLLAALAWSLIPHGGPPQAAVPEDRTPGEGASGRTAPTRPEAPAATAPSDAHAPSGEIRVGTLVGTDEAGHKQWQITADDVLLVRGRQVVVLRNVRGTFYDSSGRAISVTGQHGRYNTDTREVDLEGAVHGVSSNGREIFADALHYSPASASVTGTGHIRVVEERVIMFADRMVSDTTLGQTRFFGHVHMTLR